MKQENQNLKNETLKIEIAELNKQRRERESTVSKLSTELHQLETSCQYLETLLHAHESVALFNSDSNSYIPAYRQAVMKLTGLNVATSKVNDVINTSLKLVGKSLENCHSRKTADAIGSETVAVSSAQVGQKLKGKNTTLYSDETNKFGKTYNTFLISDDDKNVYCLGFRDMCNK